MSLDPTKPLCGWCGKPHPAILHSTGICPACANRMLISDPESPVLRAAHGDGDGTPDEVAPVVAGGAVQRGELGGREADRNGKAGGLDCLVGQVDPGLRNRAKDGGAHPSREVEALRAGDGGGLRGELGIEADGHAGVSHGQERSSGVCRSSTSDLTV